MKPVSGASAVSRHLRALLCREPGREPVIDGVRAIAIAWVVLFHVVFFHEPLLAEQTEAVFRGGATAWLAQGALGVDLFFVISGLLIGGMLMQEHAETGGIRLRRFYARRLLRLTPVYAVVIALIVAAGGKNWHNAWANLLYVNNFLPIDEQFLGWCWSLAIEEQFYLVAPLLLLLLLGRARRPLWCMGALLLLSGAIRLWVMQHHELVPPFRAHWGEPEFSHQFDTLYDKLHVRYGGLLTGVVGAYLTRFHRDALRRWFARTAVTATMMLLSAVVVVGIASLPASHGVYGQLDPLLAQLLYAVHRDVFAVAVMLLILAAMHGRCAPARALSAVLSARWLYPLAQISYTTYLVHEAMMVALFPVTAPYLQQAWGLGGLAVIVVDGLLAMLGTTVVCVLLFVLVERPSMELRRSAAFRRLAGEPASDL